MYTFREKEGIQLEDVKKSVLKKLVIGKKYILDTKEIKDNRDDDCEIKKMRCIALYKMFALFEDERGRKESFLYQDLEKML